jgi:hypothetical protein
MKNTWFARLPVCIVSLCPMLVSFSAFSQGSLTPPGAPAPMMKSLDQIEARIPINAVNTPGDASSLFRITNSGSYYLTGSILGASNKYGIYITGTNVSIDLNGFSLIGVPDSRSGISANNHSVAIRNGFILDWADFGVVHSSEGLLLENLVITRCGNTNFQGAGGGAGAGAKAVVRNSVFSRNLGYGLYVGDSSVLSDCVLSQNFRSGSSIGQRCRVSNCTVTWNKEHGISIGDGSVVHGLSVGLNDRIGISAGTGVVLENCVSRSNGEIGINTGAHGVLRGCIAGSNGGAGIETGANALLRDCRSNGNNGAGIHTGASSSIRDCDVVGNQGSGIETSGTGSRVEACHSRSNTGFGIRSLNGVGADWILRNTASGNIAGNYSPASGASFAPIQTLSTQTNPSANF